MVKRKTGFYERLCSIENIRKADECARENKKNCKTYIEKHDEHREEENQKLLQSFIDLSYKTSPYTKQTIYEPKERILYKLPYYPDRIAQWAIMNVIEEYWNRLFIRNTYSCIKGRGIQQCYKDVKAALENTKDNDETEYCLKIDIRKFYPSIDHEILKDILRWKIKDEKFLAILYEIVDSINGYGEVYGKSVPIGNYLSQFFANLYLTKFDHWCKEVLKLKYYYRYADDIVVLGNSKDRLREVLHLFDGYLANNLKLEIKHNYQIFPVESRGIDFVGFVFRHEYVLLRKSIKKKMIRLANDYMFSRISESAFRKRMASYFGWCKYSDSKHLLSHIYRLTGVDYSNFKGKLKNISSLKGKSIYIVHVSEHDRYYMVEFIYKGRPCVAKTTSNRYINSLLDGYNDFVV